MAVKATVMLTLESFMSAVHVHCICAILSSPVDIATSSSSFASKRDFFQFPFSAQKNSALLLHIALAIITTTTTQKSTQSEEQ